MSSVTGLVFLVNTNDKTISLAGDVPASYNGISGLTDVDYSILQDLNTTFAVDAEDLRYQHLGFFTEADTLALGVDPTLVANQKAAAWEIKWNSLDQTRNDLIQAQQWRVDRYNSETLLNITHTEDITPVLLYQQAIRDLPTNYPDPYNIVWPTVPPLPSA